MTKVTALLCTYEEAACVSDVIMGLRACIPGISILVVDDDSLDGTAGIAAAHVADVILRRGVPRGRGLAGIEGYLKCIDSGSDIILEMDADGSHDPRDAARLVDALRDADLAIGVRYSGGADERSMLRRILSSCAHIFLRLTLGLGLSDPTSGFRAFRRELLEKIDPASLRARGPEIVEEVYAAARRLRARTVEVPIRFHPRAAGESKLSVMKLLRVLIACLKIRLTGHA